MPSIRMQIIDVVMWHIGHMYVDDDMQQECCYDIL